MYSYYHTDLCKIYAYVHMYNIYMYEWTRVLERQQLSEEQEYIHTHIYIYIEITLYVHTRWLIITITTIIGRKKKK